jgi:hypothetical protein
MSQPARRWLRRGLIGLVVLILVAVAAVAALPWALGTSPARRWLLARVDHVLAPGRLEVASFRFSWFGPTQMTGFVIRDHQGDRVVDAPRATWDRSLRQILFDRPRLGTLQLRGAALDIERRADGTIDLYEALAPVLSDDPRLDLTVLVESGTLRFRDAALAAPVVAGRAEVVLKLAAAPRPITWSVELFEQAAGLKFVGRFDRWGAGATGRHDLAIQCSATRWPIVFTAAGVSGRAQLDGHAEAIRSEGQWTTGGDARLLAIEAEGQLLAGDRLVWDEVRGRWTINQGSGGWEIRQLEIKAPVGSMSARGSVPPTASEATRIEGSIDLAAIARELPRALRLPEGMVLDKGSLRLAVDAKPGAEATAWDLQGRVLDMEGKIRGEGVLFREPVLFKGHLGGSKASLPFDVGLSLGESPWTAGPATLLVAGNYASRSDTLELSRLEWTEPRGTLAARGSISELRSRPLATLDGTLAPNWERVNEELARRVEPDARVVSGPITFHARGPVTGSADVLWRALEVQIKGELRSADVYGLRLGPTAIAARGTGGSIVFDPLDGTLNGGKLHLEPHLRADERGKWILMLDDKTTLDSAEINDEVSHRFLAYVVPVIDRATRARGKVSVALDRAEVPLDANAGRKAVVEGNVVFRDVEFAPGPLAVELLGLAGRDDLPAIKLNQPVVLSISDGKVHQRGLAIPLGTLTAITLEGTVDFDRNIDLVASLPLTSRMFPNRPVLGDIAGGTQLGVPITGTLAEPRIDREAFAAGMKDFGVDLLRRGAMRGAAELLFRLAQPREPAPPPPPRMTPEERRAQRQQRRAERRERNANP